eukprot:4322625-Prymnesium_polylepis.4
MRRKGYSFDCERRARVPRARKARKHNASLSLSTKTPHAHSHTSHRRWACRRGTTSPTMRITLMLIAPASRASSTLSSPLQPPRAPVRGVRHAQSGERVTGVGVDHAVCPVAEPALATWSPGERSFPTPTRPPGGGPQRARSGGRRTFRARVRPRRTWSAAQISAPCSVAIVMLWKVCISSVETCSITCGGVRAARLSGAPRSRACGSDRAACAQTVMSVAFHAVISPRWKVPNSAPPPDLRTATPSSP